MTDTAAAQLTGRALVVTGASSGIGRAIAIAAARAGADVALTYLGNETGAREVEREIVALGRRAIVFQTDIASPVAVKELGAAARKGLGRLDAWINNAGADILTGAGALLSDLEKLDLLVSVDLRGTMLASWQAVEIFAAQEEGGVIINMSWDHVLSEWPGAIRSCMPRSRAACSRSANRWPAQWPLAFV
jgi:3-oxoacyl-[acyl-carrier protein] reductase